MNAANLTADVIIVGAGVIGSSIALELARNGRRVLVLERGPSAGSGSTNASSAIIRFHYSTWAGAATAWEAKHAWQDWAGHLGGIDPVGMARYITRGTLVMDFPGFDSDRVLSLYDRLAIPYERLSGAQVHDRFPEVSSACHYPPRSLADETFWRDPPGTTGAFWTPEGGYVDDPALAAQNLLRAAQRDGALVLFRTEVTAVLREPQAVCGVLLGDGRSAHAPIVINAAGPHSGRINDLAGAGGDFRVKTRPLRQEVHSVPDGPSATLRPTVSDGDLGIYFRPSPGGGLLVGGLEPECDPLVWLDDPDRNSPYPTTAVYEAQTTRLARRLPQTTVPPRPAGIAGVYDVADDWIPIYDRTAINGFYVAIGTSGNQFKNAPVVGDILRSLIEADEAGRHDEQPVLWSTPRLHLEIDLSHYSRLRTPNPDSSNTVLG